MATPPDDTTPARDEHGPLSRSRLRREAIQAERTPPDLNAASDVQVNARKPEPVAPAEGLRELLTKVVTKWALMYPLANWPWPGRTLAGADAEHLDAIARSIAAAWGADIADRVLAVRDEELEQLRAELAEERAKHQTELTSLQALADRCRSADWAHSAEQVRRREEAEAERDGYRTAVAGALEAFDGTTPGAVGNSKLDALLQRAADGRVFTDDAQNLGRIVGELLDRLARIRAALDGGE